MGALLTALIGCGTASEAIASEAVASDATPQGTSFNGHVPATYLTRLKGQVIVSYNSQSLAGAVPGWRELWTREDFRPGFSELGNRLRAAGSEQAAEAAGFALNAASTIAQALGFNGGAQAIGGRDRVAELYAPMLAQLPPLLQNVGDGIEDFVPVDAELRRRFAAEFPAELPVLLVRFRGDPIDQTLKLKEVLESGRRETPQVPIQLVELSGSHLSPNVNEPVDIIDGTDALGRTALGAETPIDAMFLAAGGEILGLVNAIADFVAPASPPALMAAAAAPKRLRLAGLTANDFRHPLDRRQTRALERVPGLAGVVRRVVSIAEQAIYQDNVSSSVLVGEGQYPRLHTLLRRACDVLDIAEDQRPELYVRQNPTPNAYTLAVQGKRPFVVLHTALLNLCCEAEVEVVIAHELGHLKCEHGVWLSAANVLLLGTAAAGAALSLPAEVVRPILERLQDDLGEWQRAAELSCDRAALLVAQEPWTALSVLLKLSGGGVDPSIGEGAQAVATRAVVSKRESIEAFLAQAKRLDEARAEAGPMGALVAAAINGGRTLTHPIPVLRAREMRRWADSEQFRAVLSERGEPLPEE